MHALGRDAVNMGRAKKTSSGNNGRCFGNSKRVITEKFEHHL